MSLTKNLEWAHCTLAVPYSLVHTTCSIHNPHRNMLTTAYNRHYWKIYLPKVSTIQQVTHRHRRPYIMDHKSHKSTQRKVQVLVKKRGAVGNNVRCSLLCSLYALSTFYDLLFMIACIALYNAVATYFSFTAQHTWLISWRKYKLDTIFISSTTNPLTWSGLQASGCPAPRCSKGHSLGLQGGGRWSKVRVSLHNAPQKVSLYWNLSNHRELLPGV